MQSRHKLFLQDEAPSPSSAFADGVIKNIDKINLAAYPIAQ
ncbi:hypothetical protein [Campylobacter sp.]|nr:hypothetical protein [Campylobacter sp.]